MNVYRLDSEIDLDRIIENSEIQGTGEWNKNPETVFVYVSNNPIQIIDKFFKGISLNRELDTGEILYVLKILIDENNLEEDNTQNGWSESRKHNGSIPINLIEVIGSLSNIGTIFYPQPGNNIIFVNPINLSINWREDIENI